MDKMYILIYDGIMPTVSATYAKQNFAEMIDTAQREPVCIRRHDRKLAVLISAEEYERIRKLRAEELIRLSSEMTRYAESKGMTDEVFAQLMADER
jgi:prevent-host-death family protein